MGGWIEFAAAFAVFFASHMIPARPAIRGWLTAAMGERIYLVAYIILSLLVLAWLIGAAARAPYVELWPYEEWQRHVPQIAMLAACLLTTFGLGIPGGLSLGSRKDAAFNPARPGFAAVTRHPLLWAVALWSSAHLVPNGDLAHVILFGSFAATALAGMAVFDRRTKRRIGGDAWQDVQRATAVVPFARGIGAMRGIDRPVIRALAGIALYGALFLSHAPLIGVPPG